LTVDLPDDDDPKADCYIDDLFSAFLEECAARGSAILPFVIHLLGRPLGVKESLPRDDLLSLKKFLAGATPSQTKVVLGWILQTCCLTIALPPNKYTA